MKIAITGSTGFIGRNVAKRFQTNGHIVYPISSQFESIECDRVYHFACPATTERINADPIGVMDIILDATRLALKICPTALFINASTKGAVELENSPQGCYNIAKRCMETYVEYSGVKYINYRIPSVYGPDMNDDGFIKRCVDGRAFKPLAPNKKHYIAHIDDVVDALVNLTEIHTEEITLGEIYESFSTGRLGLYRPAPN